MRQVIEEDIDDRRRVQGKDLAQQQTANHRDTQRTAQFRADTGSKRQWQPAQQRRHRRHHDRPESKQTGLVDRIGRIFSLIPLRIQREVHHHDSVLFHDSDQQNQSDDRHHAQVMMKEDQRQERANARRRKSGKNRDRMDEAFVQNSQARYTP